MKFKAFYLSFLSVALLGACAEDVINGDISKEDSSKDEIAHTGIPVSFSGIGEDLKPADETSAKLMKSVQETRLNYYQNIENQNIDVWNNTLAWEPNDKISVIQIAKRKGDTKVYTNSDGSLTPYSFAVTTTKPAIETNFQVEGNKMYWYKDASSYQFVATHPSVSTGDTPGIKDIRPYLNDDYTLNDTKIAKVTFILNKQQKSVWRYEYTPNTDNSSVDISIKKSVTTSDSKEIYAIGYSAQQETMGGNVQMKFTPLLTSLTITLPPATDEDLYVKGVRIYLKQNGTRIPFPDKYVVNHKVWKYTYTVPGNSNSQTKTLDYFNQIESSERLNNGTTDYIQVSVLDQNGNPAPLKKNTYPNDKNGGIVFGAMLPPLPYGKDGYSLEVEPIYSLPEYQMSSVMLANSTNDIFVPGTKIIREFVTPRPTVIFTGKNWMSKLQEANPNKTILLKDLSIPGSHHSGFASDLYNSDNVGEDVRHPTQKLDIYDQLNAGVRVLDLRVAGRVDGGSFARNNFQNTDHYGISGFNGYLGGSTYYSGDKSTSENPYANYGHQMAMNSILDFLSANPSEAVIVIIGRGGTYSSNTNATSLGRGAVYEFMRYLSALGKLVAYSDNLSLANAKGKVVVMHRADAKLENNSYPYFDGTNSIAGVAAFQNWPMTDYNESKSSDQPRNWYGSTTFNMGVGADKSLFKSYAQGGDYYSENFAFTWTNLFKTTNVNNSSDWTQESRIWFLDREIVAFDRKASTKRVNWGGTYWIGQGSGFADFTSQSYLNLKPAVVKDFLDMAASTQYKNDWFLTIVPGASLLGNVENSKNGERIWRDTFTQTHQPVLTYLQEHLGNRFGMILFDFVSNNRNDETNKLGKNLVFNTIKSNFVRTW